jgi:hypothetical protein
MECAGPNVSISRAGVGFPAVGLLKKVRLGASLGEPFSLSALLGGSLCVEATPQFAPTNQPRAG